MASSGKRYRVCSAIVVLLIGDAFAATKVTRPNTLFRGDVHESPDKRMVRGWQTLGNHHVEVRERPKLV
jgi:hypothetical protein